MRLGPLSLGTIGEILHCRLGTIFPRHTLTRLYDASGGNPFYALECACALLEHPQLARTNEPIPVSDDLRDLVPHSVRHLTPSVRRMSWLVAASSRPRERLIRAAIDGRESWAVIDQAIDVGFLERDGEVLRFTHPLLRAVLYADMTAAQRRAAHQRLAASAEGIEERAWHLALGADRPGREFAGVLDAAATHAGSRGAPDEAAALTEQAIRLTPAERSCEVRERIVRAADYHFRAGDMARSRELVESVLAGGVAGAPSAPLLLRLATILYHQGHWPLAEHTLRRAVEAAPDDPALRAQAEQELAIVRLVAGDLPGACRWAEVSLRSAEQAAIPRLVAQSLTRVAALEFFQGNAVWADLLVRSEQLDASVREESAGRSPLFGPALTRGLLCKWCDQLDQARLRLAGQYQHALNRGNEAALPFLLHHLSELETWAGNWDAAEEYAVEGCPVASVNHQQTAAPATLYSLSLVRAHRGQVQDAWKLASEALVLCDQTGNVPVASQALAVLGFVALSLDDQTVHAHLGALADRLDGVGFAEPGVVKFLPDEIEALAALGEIDRAWLLTRQLGARGESLGRCWAQATSARCRALLAAIDGDLPAARAACEQALLHHEKLPMPFELARTLLIKGMIERRARCRQAARDSLGRALTAFDHLGARLWADKARREFVKTVTGLSEGGLTETERRIAALITRGQTNREIASKMFVTENTVQTHIRHIYQKLGVRSRTELAAQLLSAPAGRNQPHGRPASSLMP